MSQRSISSYFSSKPTPSSGKAKTDDQSPKPAKSPTGTSKDARKGTTAAATVPADSDDELEASNSAIRKRGHTQQNGNAELPVAKKRRQSEESSPVFGGSENKKQPSRGKGVLQDKFSFIPSSSPMRPSQDDGQTDPDELKQKRRRHEKFVTKLGNPDSLRFTEMNQVEGDAEGEDADEIDEDEEPEQSKNNNRKSSKATSKGGWKLTPLEQQVVEIKLKNMDTLLVIEVGYKFRFFGEDARIAASVLNIMCISGRMKFVPDPAEEKFTRFASASIPTHRLHVHVKRLVAAGHKVGVVRQQETAALKAVGDNKNAPFVRKLTNLYTKGTYVDEVEGLDEVTGAGSGAPNTGYLLCLTEKLQGGSGADEMVKIAMLAVQPSTGDILYDEFGDGFMRSEIETRLLHVSPCEFLILGELSHATEKLVNHLAATKSNVFGEKIRVERVDKGKKMSVEAASHVGNFYAKKAQGSVTEKSRNLLDVVLNLPEDITCCLSAMITHLQCFGLEHVFDLTKYFENFSTRSHMVLNGNTLSSLEIYRNQSDFTEKGSLFWCMDRTHTRSGRRMLRKWVGRPLLDKARLEQRTAAVEEFTTSTNWKTEKLKELLKSVKVDLEKALIRVYYGKASRSEVLSSLKALRHIAATFPAPSAGNPIGYKSDLINDCIASLPKILMDVESFLGIFNHQAASKDDKYEFFIETEEYDKISDIKMSISGVEMDLESHLKEAAKLVKKNKLAYTTVSGIDHLIEIENAAVKNVPSSWVKISGTKRASRFHTPEVIKMLRERDQLRESLAAECDNAFKRFLTDIATKYQEFRDAVQSLATLDCLLSLANIATQPGYVKPTFTEESIIKVQKGRHPMVEQLLLDAYVPNDIDMSSEIRRAMLITGPNMGGKSSFVRQVALICIMAQIGSYVPAEAAELGLLDAIFTRMGAFDNMMKGESTFMVELSETSDIIKQATKKSLVILDELGRGTSTHDGVAIAYAVLDHMITEIGAMTLFVTHYPILAQFGEKYPGEVINAHMKFEEASDGSEDITFLYQVTEGVAHRSYGLNVAKLANVPKSVLITAAAKSKELEDELKGRELTRLISNISVSDDADMESIQQILHLV